jgi:CRISPR-associated protein Csd2
MAILNNKIDFSVILTVHNANPNGDPLNGNRPRENYDGTGEISDVCIKRKIRNRLMDMGYPVFVQSDDRATDGYKSLHDRMDGDETLKKEKDKDAFAKRACENWIDVRSFGQVFAFKGATIASVGVRGPVSVQSAFSKSPVDIDSLQITKSVNGETGDKRSSDTMGMKHRIPFGMYVFHGSINCQLAEKTGFSDEDAEAIHRALPEGSMEVNKVYWWRHSCKSGQYSSAKVHRALHITTQVETPREFDDYQIAVDELPGLTPQVDDGL